MRQIILASQSPRRKELLEKMGLEFTIVPSSFEEQLDNSRSPEHVALELATGKAHDVAKRFPEAIVIGSDTIVTINDKQLGKPKDEKEARKTLEMLAGQVNFVTTAVVVLCHELDKELSEVITSKVLFKPLNKKTLDKYLKSGDWQDKAGSYGLQSGAAPLVDYIEGAYDAILGLPTTELARLLDAFEVSSKPVKLDPPVDLR